MDICRGDIPIVLQPTYGGPGFGARHSAAGRRDSMNDRAANSSGGRTTPFWTVLILAICTMQIGPSLAIVGGYQLHWSGAAGPFVMASAAFLSILVAAAIAYIARRYVGSGGILSYVQVALPHWSVCVVAGTLLLGYIIGPSANIMWAATYLSGLLLQFGIDSAASPLTTAALIVLIAAGAGYCAYRGLEMSAKISIVLGLACIPIAIAITALAVIRTDFSIDYSGALAEMSLVDLARGTFIALSFFVGFDGISAMASETSDPKRNVPRLLAWSLGLAGITNTAGVLLQTPILIDNVAALEAGQTPTYVLMSAARMESLNVIFDIMLYMAALAGIIAWLNISALIVATAARDGLLPRSFEARHPKTGSPHRTIILLSTFSVVLPILLQAVAEQAMLISMVYLINVLVLYWLVAYGFVSAATIVLHHRNRRPPGVAYAASVAAILAIAGILVVQSANPFDEVYSFMNISALILLLVSSVAFYVSTRHKRDALNAFS